jgi:hypothetical protein
LTKHAHVQLKSLQKTRPSRPMEWQES